MCVCVCGRVSRRIGHPPASATLGVSVDAHARQRSTPLWVWRCVGWGWLITQHDSTLTQMHWGWSAWRCGGRWSLSCWRGGQWCAEKAVSEVEAWSLLKGAHSHRLIAVPVHPHHPSCLCPVSSAALDPHQPQRTDVRIPCVPCPAGHWMCAERRPATPCRGVVCCPCGDRCCGNQKVIESPQSCMPCALFAGPHNEAYSGPTPPPPSPPPHSFFFPWLFFLLRKHTRESEWKEGFVLLSL